MGPLEGYLSHSVEFVLNRVYDRFHENGIGNLVTHLVLDDDDNSLRRRLSRLEDAGFVSACIDIPMQLLEQ